LQESAVSRSDPVRHPPSPRVHVTPISVFTSTDLSVHMTPISAFT
jgi:hypothetical protein